MLILALYVKTLTYPILHQVVFVTKIKRGENLAGEIFQSMVQALVITWATPKGTRV